jgi:hypothetical protein
MPFTLIQAGTSLQMADAAGALTTLTLPTGVVLTASRKPGFAVMGRYVVMVNSPSRPITIDPDGIVRLLCPQPPSSKPVLAATGSGGLSGTFRVRYAHIVLDNDGNLIAHSPYSPVSDASAVLAAQDLEASQLSLSTDTITARRVVRTVTGPGLAFFQWVDLDGNSAVRFQDDLSDAALNDIAALDDPDLGLPPQLTLVAEWRDRLWGVDRVQIDTLRATPVGTMYAWPAALGYNIPSIGSDDRGVTALLRRRDELGVSRNDSLHKMTGTLSTNFVRLGVGEGGLGASNQETVVVIRDVAYYLGQDGVYTWGADGVHCISDEYRVSAWFKTDTYFNRGRFRYAFARYEPRDHAYQLFLAALGSSSEDRWIEFYLPTPTRKGRFLGIHRTSEFSPTAAGIAYDSNTNKLAALGSSSGFLWKRNAGVYADGVSSISMSVDTIHSGASPDIQKYFGELDILSRKEASGTLTITPRVGDLSAAAQVPIAVDLTLGRQRCRRMCVSTDGGGRFLQLNFAMNTLNRGTRIYGFEVDFHELGRR